MPSQAHRRPWPCALNWVSSPRPGSPSVALPLFPGAAMPRKRRLSGALRTCGRRWTSGKCACPPPMGPRNTNYASSLVFVRSQSHHGSGSAPSTARMIRHGCQTPFQRSRSSLKSTFGHGLRPITTSRAAFGWSPGRPRIVIATSPTARCSTHCGLWLGRRTQVKLDEARVMQLISPRKQKAWAQSYRIGRAARAGRKDDAPGRAALAKRRQSAVFDPCDRSTPSKSRPTSWMPSTRSVATIGG